MTFSLAEVTIDDSQAQGEVNLKRFAVLADIHGNLPALKAVLQDVHRLGVDGIWALGDYLIGGPGPNEVMRLLVEAASVMILGNNERYLLDFDAGLTPERRTAPQWMPMRWAYQHLDRQWLELIRELPEQRVLRIDGAPPVRLVHGSHRRLREPLLPDDDPLCAQRFREAGFWAAQDIPTRLSEVLDELEEQALLCGHTHIPWIQRRGDLLAVNVGSVGGPIDGDPHARYALVTWTGERWEAELRGVSYDWSQVYDNMMNSGYWNEVGEMARALWLGVRSGQNVVYALLTHARQMAVQAGYGHLPVVPDDIWRYSVKTFDWERAEKGLPMFS